VLEQGIDGEALSGLNVDADPDGEPGVVRQDPLERTHEVTVVQRARPTPLHSHR
jgi:hypothetical protein